MNGRPNFSAFSVRSGQASGLSRHSVLPVLIPEDGLQSLQHFPPPELMGNKIAAQEAEIERLAGENHRLAAAHLAMRQDLAADQQEVQRLKDHIRSIHNESDIQIRILVDKITKMEATIKAGEIMKEELQKALMEARTLVAARQELNSQIQQTLQDLQKVRFDSRGLPGMHAELNNLRNEHQGLRAAFEYEKGLNTDRVEQLKSMERHMIGMAREIESLRAEVVNAEKRELAPNPLGGGYMKPDQSYQLGICNGGSYGDGMPPGRIGVEATQGRIPLGPQAAGRVGGAASPSANGSTEAGDSSVA